MSRFFSPLFLAFPGDIKDDNYFMTAGGDVVLGDFGTVWRLSDGDGVRLRLGSRDELLDRRAGTAPGLLSTSHRKRVWEAKIRFVLEYPVICAHERRP